MFVLEILQLGPISPSSIDCFLYCDTIFDTCDKMVFTPISEYFNPQ